MKQKTPLFSPYDTTQSQKTKRGVSIHSELDIEVNTIQAHVMVHGNSAVISFNRWGDSLRFFRSTMEIPAMENLSLKRLNEFLQSIGLTIYLQNRGFAVLGPRAGLITPKVFKIISYLAGIKFRH